MVDTRIRAHACAAGQRIRDLAIVFPAPAPLREQLADWLQGQVSADALFASAQKFLAVAGQESAARRQANALELARIGSWLLEEASVWPASP